MKKILLRKEYIYEGNLILINKKYNLKDKIKSYNLKPVNDEYANILLDYNCSLALNNILQEINSKKEILLQKRSATKESNPNRWTVSASGHLVTGDSSYDAAVRETEEELGIKVKTQKLEYLFTVKEQQRPKEGFLDNEFIDIYWLLMDNDIPNFKIQKEEVAEIRWVSYEEFKKMVKNKDKRLVQHDEIHYQLFQQLEKNCRKKEI